MYILLTALAFLCHIPFVAPVAFGLMAGPAVVIPLICGTVAYYMIDYVRRPPPPSKEGGRHDRAADGILKAGVPE